MVSKRKDSVAKRAKKKRVIQLNREMGKKDKIAPILYSAIGMIVILILAAMLFILPIKIFSNGKGDVSETAPEILDDTRTEQGLSLPGDESGALAAIYFYDLTSKKQDMHFLDFKPKDMAAGDDGIIYFTNPKENKLISYNPAKKEQTTAAVGSNPGAVALFPDNSFAVVANEDTEEKVGQDTISIVKLDSMKETARIIVGERPMSVAISPDSTHVIVGMRKGDIVMVDIEAKSIDGRASIGKKLVSVAYHPQGHTAYALSADEETIYFIDVSKMVVSAEIRVGKGASSMALVDARTLLVANSVDDTVDVIDLLKIEKYDHFTVGQKPMAIAIGEEAGYVANMDGMEVSVVDLSNMLEQDLIELEIMPYKIFIDGETLVVLGE